MRKQRFPEVLTSLADSNYYFNFRLQKLFGKMRLAGTQFYYDFSFVTQLEITGQLSTSPASSCVPQTLSFLILSGTNKFAGHTASLPNTFQGALRLGPALQALASAASLSSGAVG